MVLADADVKRLLDAETVPNAGAAMILPGMATLAAELLDAEAAAYRSRGCYGMNRACFLSDGLENKNP